MIDQAAPLDENDLPARTGRRWFIGILLIAFGLRLLVALWLGHSPLHIDDEKSYDDIAERLVASGHFAVRSGERTSLRPPLQPAVLAAIYAICGNHNYLAARVFQAVLGTATIFPLFALARGIFSRRVAVWTIAMYAIEPSLVGFCSLLLSETLFTLLLVFSCYLMQGLLHDGRYRWAVGFGMTAGLAALTRSILLPMLPLILMFVLWAAREWRWPKRLGLAVSLGLAFLAVVGPWIARNTHLEGTFTTIDSIGGRNFMMGNYEHTPLMRSWDTFALHTGTERSWDDILAKQHAGYSALSQGGRDKLALHHGIAFVLSHPALSIQRSCVKFFDFWQLERTLLGGLQRGWWGNVSGHWLWPAALAIEGVHAAVLLLGIVGLWIARPAQPQMHWFILLLILLTAAVHTVIFAHSRYRLPLTPLLLAYAASTVAALQTRRVPWRQWKFVAACATAGLLLISWGVQFAVYDLQRLS